jgi:hypothetical protein
MNGTLTKRPQNFVMTSHWDKTSPRSSVLGENIPSKKCDKTSSFSGTNRPSLQCKHLNNFRTNCPLSIIVKIIFKFALNKDSYLTYTGIMSKNREKIVSSYRNALSMERFAPVSLQSGMECPGTYRPGTFRQGTESTVVYVYVYSKTF